MRNYFTFKSKGNIVRGKLKQEINNEVAEVANLVNEIQKGTSKNIIALEKTDGIVTRDKNEIKNIINKYYQDLFTVQNHNPEKRTQILERINSVITCKENDILTERIGPEEVFLAILSLKEKNPPE